jgi:galactokinase
MSADTQNLSIVKDIERDSSALSALRGSLTRLDTSGEALREGISCSVLLKILEMNSPRLKKVLSRVYGESDEQVIEGRRHALRDLARQFFLQWGDREVRVFRAPGRIALNPHCEHQGAWVPYGTHRREMIALMSPRPDDVFTLTSVSPDHKKKMSFRLREEIALAPEAWQAGWEDYIEDDRVVALRESLADPKTRILGKTGGLNFVKAAVLRLAREVKGERPGADIVINGDIPIGAGLSSSSAIVVVTALALQDLWEVPFDLPNLVRLCGEAEWFVGTRGGAGDHAAMLLGSGAGNGLTEMRFLPPVTVQETRQIALPEGYQIIIANSGERAIKNKEERRHFNSGIFAYKFALAFLKDALHALGPELNLNGEVEKTRFLGDITTESFSLEAIFRLLRAVPEMVSPREIEQRYPESFAGQAHACFGTTDPDLLPASIPVRGAAMYGVARADRGLRMHELLLHNCENAMGEFGLLMSITHDGDRVSRFDPEREQSHYYTDNLESVSDAHLDWLVAQAKAGPSGKYWEQIQLRRQPGFYGASTLALDRMADTVGGLEEVLGAGLMGAGGGGCLLILAKAGEGALFRVREELERKYFRPTGKAVEVEAWHATAPAGRVFFRQLLRETGDGETRPRLTLLPSSPPAKI